MKPLMILWNGEPLNWSGNPVTLPVPASPVQSCRKFSAVWHVRSCSRDHMACTGAAKADNTCLSVYLTTFGAMSLYSSKMTLPKSTVPVGPPLMATSKYTRGFASLRRTFLTLGMLITTSDSRSRDPGSDGRASLAQLQCSARQ